MAVLNRVILSQVTPIERHSPEQFPLFKENSHSAWQIKYRSVPEGERAQLSDVLIKNFSTLCGHIASIEEVDEAEINNQNFRVRTQTAAGEKHYLLRRVGVDFSTEGVRRRIEILQRLAQKGCKVPNALMSDTGEKIVEHGGHRYILFDFLHANHYRGTFKELTDAGYEIGTLDRELLSLTGTYGDNESLQLDETFHDRRKYSDLLWKDIFQRIEAFRQSGQYDQEFNKLVLASGDKILRATDITEGRLLPSARQISHIDLHPHNLLTDGSATVAVLDIDALFNVEKMRAVSFALHRLVRQHIVYSGYRSAKEAVPDVARAFVEAYRAQNTLSDDELRSVPLFIIDEALARLTTILKEYAYTGKLPWSRSEFIKHMTSIAEAEYFERL